MIVVALIATISSIAIPNLLSARLASNEAAAIATLRNVVSAQAATKACGAIDQDADGIGEYAWLAEMGGTIAVRDSSGPHGGPLLRPPSLSASLGAVNANGVVSKSGYLYRMSLPGAGGAPLVESAGGGSPTGEDPDLSEMDWIAYAWPQRFANSGRRAFAVNQSGDVVQTDNRGGAAGTYQGTANMPAPDAALENGAAGTILGEFSLAGVPALAVDGKLWKIVN